MRIMLKSKIHRARVTQTNSDDEGSITIDANLLETTTDASGDVALTVPPLGLVIYQASVTIPDSPAAPSILISNLSNGQEVVLEIDNQDGHDVIERLEVGAQLGSDI